MKTIITVVVLAVSVALIQGASSPGFKAKIRPLAEKCRETVKVTDDELEAIVNLEVDVSRDGKCLMTCIQEVAGFVKDKKFVDHKVTEAIYRKIFEDDPERLKHSEEGFKQCLDKAIAISDTDLCEASYIATKCVAEK